MVGWLVDKYPVALGGLNALDKEIELGLPLLFSVSPVNIIRMYRRWLENGLPTGWMGNLTLCFFEECVTVFGGINQCWFPRATVSLNYSFIVAEVITCQRIFKGTLVTARLLPESTSYCDASKSMQTMVGVRGLGAQHGLYYGTDRRWIGAKYVGDATLCEGTETAKKLAKQLKLPVATLKRVYLNAAFKRDTDGQTMEETVCSGGREMVNFSVPFNKEAAKEGLEKREKNQRGFKRAPDVMVYGQHIPEIRQREGSERKREGQDWVLVHNRRVFSDDGEYEDVSSVMPLRDGPREMFVLPDPAKPFEWNGKSFADIANVEVKISQDSTRRVPKSRKAKNDGDGESKTSGRKRARDDDEECSSTNAFYSSIPKKMKHRISFTNRRLRNSSKCPISYSNLLDATVDAGTYRVIPMHSIAARVVDGAVTCDMDELGTDGDASDPNDMALVTSGRQQMDSKKKKKRSNNRNRRKKNKKKQKQQQQQRQQQLPQKKKLVMVDAIAVRYCGQEQNGYTASMLCGNQTIRTMIDGEATWRYDQLNCFDGDVVYYASRDKAKMACFVNVSCTVPYLTGKITDDGVPNWVDELLPLDRMNLPGRDYCVLYETKRAGIESTPTTVLFGILSFQGSDRVLSLATRDYPCPEQEWQTINFRQLAKTLKS